MGYLVIKDICDNVIKLIYQLNITPTKPDRINI